MPRWSSGSPESAVDTGSPTLLELSTYFRGFLGFLLLLNQPLKHSSDYCRNYLWQRHCAGARDLLSGQRTTFGSACRSHGRTLMWEFSADMLTLCQGDELLSELRKHPSFKWTKQDGSLPRAVVLRATAPATLWNSSFRKKPFVLSNSGKVKQEFTQILIRSEAMEVLLKITWIVSCAASFHFIAFANVSKVNNIGFESSITSLLSFS